ncbi:hypothetical protein QBC38DRAFT_256582 [Podospora fimiseda]|uniref:Peregrin n=1 Tax=Podospora fimiseda TaxID=252190 RepID=A0AAN7BLC4_9PEZI|nr:hypothetical protein QBC38DRAFT_256582 [Podospora fimiseda]
MVSGPTTPRRQSRSRARGRPKTSEPASASRVRKAVMEAPDIEPPQKRRRYIPGGPGGGGRFIDDDGREISIEDSGLPTTSTRARATRPAASPVYPRRERSTRIRTAVNRDELDDMQYSSAAAVAAAVVQSEGYKPREERGWEEFHPQLDIDATFMFFTADEVDGLVTKSVPPTPAGQASGIHLNESGTPTKDSSLGLGGSVNGTPSGQGKPSLAGMMADTPSRRRPGRPTRDSVSLYATRPLDLVNPKIPKVLPIQTQTAKERLDLKQPSFRKTDRIALFESKEFGQARYLEKSMTNVGYQESDNFIRDHMLIKASDANTDEDNDQTAAMKAGSDPIQNTAGVVGRVEYDMDEQDDMWLEDLNGQRKTSDLEPIAREILEIAMTKIEKEWHALEKRIPKPNPKPPQTHRPRSSSAAAVNGEPQVGEEQDSKCAICDDGDCENTNAIVFCDGCDLAVHQECYGVPFIPEGQWLCRKCQLIGRGCPTCLFCPNTDGAFKQTNSSKWAHLLCAMWIPEVSLGNHTFMEPVMEVEKVPRTRWKLTCYICNQRMGACIQCSNKNCYQAFHVTCARRCRLYLKMKNSQGALAVLDSFPLKAFCDKHCPDDYAAENGVAQATKAAKKFYKRSMKGRIWADSAASALQLAATHRHAITEHPPDESQMTGAKVSAVLGDKKKGQPAKNVWKLPSGAPIIPQAVFDLVESALSRFPIRKRKEFVADACRYWTLKREARRGAALLKRLQLQMETFSSMELTRRDFAAMGPSGKTRLVRRIEFCQTLIKDLEQIKSIAEAVTERETIKLQAAELEQEFVDSSYFPIAKMIRPLLNHAFELDLRSAIFKQGFTALQDKLDLRFYTTTLHFARDLCEVIHTGINTGPTPTILGPLRGDSITVSPAKNANYPEARERKRIGKRILKWFQPKLEGALEVEAEICGTSLDSMKQELATMIDASIEIKQPTALSIVVSRDGPLAPFSAEDVDMMDAPIQGQIIVANHSEGEEDAEGEDDDAEGEPDDVMEGTASMTTTADAIEVFTGDHYDEQILDDTHTPEEEENEGLTNGVLKDSNSPDFVPGFNAVLHPPPDDSSGGGPPLTPPQSNGSFGRDNNRSVNVLSDGGVPWYLQTFELEGTTAVEEKWTGRDAVRSLSEELTDMDDEALKDLEQDVDDEHDTITAASPLDTAKESPSTNGVATTPSNRRKRADYSKFRKGVRSSARKKL